MTQMTLRKIVSTMQQHDLDITLLGIGPMSQLVLDVTFELARDKDFPVLLIASRNQVDAGSLGGGYVRGWDQAHFVADIKRTAQALGFGGLVYVCRDHGGPWQRDNERKERFPVPRAMEDARASFIEDVRAGFQLLHVDPTRHADGDPAVPLPTVAERTVELVRAVEGCAQDEGLPLVDYEIGTEETAGGLIEFEAFEQYLRGITESFGAEGFTPPSFIVGQTGTLVKMRQNVGTVNEEVAGRLAAIARKYGVGFKEHNADYLPDDVLKRHPAIGITAANVAPEFGVEETCGYLDLAENERRLATQGKIESPSDFTQTLTRVVFESGRWKKWLIDPWTDQDVQADPARMEEIARVAGHYCFDDADVTHQRQKMLANLEAAGAETLQPVKARVRESIDRYVRHFNLEGSTTRLREMAT